MIAGHDNRQQLLQAERVYQRAQSDYLHPVLQKYSTKVPGAHTHLEAKHLGHDHKRQRLQAGRVSKYGRA